MKMVVKRIANGIIENLPLRAYRLAMRRGVIGIDYHVVSDEHLSKFQKRTINIVHSKEYLDSPRESPWGTTQREQKEALEFG